MDPRPAMAMAVEVAMRSRSLPLQLRGVEVGKSWLDRALSEYFGVQDWPMGADIRSKEGVRDEDIPSLMEIKRVLPPHAFQSSAWRSMSYVVKDVTIVSALFCFGIYVCPSMPILYPLYWMAQGTMFWAVFVLGHDCGHSSFSRSNLLNDVVGTVLHTFILVPYYSWKLSHRSHHKNTGNMDKDEIFYPVKEKDAGGFLDGLFGYLYFGLGLGWFYYLIFGYKPRSHCHFNPKTSLYIEQFLSTAISLGAYAVWLAVLGGLTFRYGIIAMTAIYFAPILVFATWLVAVTFLHHNDTGVKWYSDKHWNYVRVGKMLPNPPLSRFKLHMHSSLPPFQKPPDSN